jgi:hypothetical protein
MRCDLTQWLLRVPNILQQLHRVEAFELRLELRIHQRFNGRVSQQPIAGGRRCEVNLVNLGAVACFGFQLERWLKEVHVQAR